MAFSARQFAAVLLSASLLALCVNQGTVTAQPKKAAAIAPSPQAPTITSVGPNGAQRGTSVDLKITGTNLDNALAAWTSFPAKTTLVADKGKEAATRVTVKLDVPADAPVGQHTLRVATKNGVSNAISFCVDDLPQIAEIETNHAKSSAQEVPIPCVVTGRTDVEMSDYFKFTVKPGQRLTFEALGRRLGSAVDPIILLHDAKSGRELPGAYSDDAPGLQSDPRLTHTFKEGGEYLVEIRDTTHRGGPDNFYRLRIGDFPAILAPVPVALKRGAKAKVGFAGSGAEGVPPVDVAVPDSPSVTAVPVTAKGPGGVSAWPVLVAVSNIDEIVDTEPNNDGKTAQKLNLPVGVTGLFGQKGDVDVYTFPAKKGAKYAIAAETYEIGSPAEVYLVLKNAKGADLGKSVPTAATARIDYTAAEDGDLFLHVEHLNYASGPNEVYHLTVRPAEPDFEVALGIDRFEAPAGGAAYIPVTGLVRRDYTGPIELSVLGPAGLTGSVTIPANFPPAMPALPAGTVIAYLPIVVKDGTAAGPIEFKVQAKGDKVVRIAHATDVVKARMANLPFPPRDMLTSLAIGVTDKQPFTLTFKSPPKDVVRGAATNLTVTAAREGGFADEITLTLVAPPNVTATIKPVGKGTNETQIQLTAAAAVPTGPLTVALKGTAKIGGKDFAVYSLPLTVNVTPEKGKEKEKEKPKEKEKDKK